jgi:anaerobic magnesium-protoporphyrin IX monomethyl ester cyclase
LPELKLSSDRVAPLLPERTCSKLRVDAVVLGECEETLVRLAELPRDRWGGVAGLCYEDHGPIVVEGGPQAADLANLPALDWPADTVGRHGRRHHRFDALRQIAIFRQDLGEISERSPK